MAPPAGGILALDLSSMVGWAHGGPAARNPTFGRWQLSGAGDEGRTFASFENVLVPCMEVHRPAWMVIERSLTFAAAAGRSTMPVMNQQLGLRSIAHKEGYRYGAQCIEVATDTVRAAVLGRARYPKGEVKPAVIAFCRAQGWDVPDDNAADACVLWCWACRAAGGRRALKLGPARAQLLG